MRMKVLYHDSCFDGAASAAVFSRFYQERVHPGAELAYQGLSHSIGAHAIDPVILDGDENAIVDFRYSQSPRLTWWFDHHQSAFQMPGDEANFRADTTGRKFHDPAAKSCTKYIARIAEENFGFNPKPLADLIYWADIIDGAQFPTPGMAVRLEEPALKLMMVIEANKDPAFIPRLIGDFQTHTLEEIAKLPYIAGPFEPLYQRHLKTIELVRSKAVLDGPVVVYDVADELLDNVNKFIAYDMFPTAKYTVAVSRSSTRSKVSVGSSPWNPLPRTHDLSKLCEKYGGGGHPVVGAISFKADDLPRARQVAQEIAAVLKT